MSTAVVAVHYQNDVVHPEGTIARHAADAGHEVVVAADACAAGDPDPHAAARRVLEPHVARVASVDEVLGELGG